MGVLRPVKNGLGGDPAQGRPSSWVPGRPQQAQAEQLQDCFLS